MKRPHSRLAIAAATIALIAIGPPEAAAAAAQDPSAAQPSDARQHAFAAAAEEYAVPESVLLAVSYHQTRWEAHAGQPSVGAGYGPMHLTDAGSVSPRHHGEDHEDRRGDPARPTAAGVTRPLAVPEALRTLPLAAGLTGIAPETLRADAAANIRGGAALLAHYQRTVDPAGATSTDAGAWYGAVARYSGAEDTVSAQRFADDVFATVASGADRVTSDGQRVSLPARPAVRPRTDQLDLLGLRPPRPGPVDCPRGLGCEWIPAPYEEWTNDDGTTDYGNHDQANRPDSQKIEYIIIHDTETSYDGTVDLVLDPMYVSWHYTLRNHDGHIAQHVRLEDAAWHAGNWYINAKSIGLEHEGYAARGTWYSEAMYRTSARLVRYLAKRYDIPLDRQHILGHDNVPAITPASVPTMHWDPGPYWDWSHYFELLGAPLRPTGNRSGALVTIKPDFATNTPAFTSCEDNPGPPGEPQPQPCGEWSSSSVILHTEPRHDAPLLNDIGLRPDGSPNTMEVSDIGSRVDAGQQFAVAEVRGDWTAIWYLGQKGWFHNPRSAPTAVRASGYVAMAKPGLASVPVYGRAYPEPEAYEGTGVPVQPVVPLPYTLPAGQRYVVGEISQPEYYYAVRFDPTNHRVIRGEDTYVQIQFGHRSMFVRAADVVVVPSSRR